MTPGIAVILRSRGIIHKRNSKLVKIKKKKSVKENYDVLLPPIRMVKTWNTDNAKV